MKRSCDVTISVLLKIISVYKYIHNLTKKINPYYDQNFPHLGGMPYFHMVVLKICNSFRQKSKYFHVAAMETE